MSKLKYESPIIKQINTGITSKFGELNSLKPVTHIANISVKSLIEQYGSPLFVINEQTIRNTYQDAYHAFSTRYPNVQFAWSYKTNYIEAVCKVFHQEGSWAEVVSGFEYLKALDNGVPGDKIIFNGPDKSDEDLKMAVENNSPIHIDHFDELYSLISITEQLNKRAKVAIRVNMDTGIKPLWDRFGFNYENGQAWEAVNKIIYSKNLDLIGFHTHIGTYILEPNAYRVAATKLADLAINVKNKFKHDIQYIDMGGGFASKNTLKGSYLSGTDLAPSFSDYADNITQAILNAGFSTEDLPLLILETGRALIDDAGTLLGTVLANKRSSDGRRSIVMDFGVNTLFTSFWYNHIISPAQECSLYTEDTVMYGPLCMNIDVIRESINLPPLNKGDHVVVHRVGAYNMSQWMQFITLRPKVVMIDTKGKTHIIRESESKEYVSELEITPDYLKNIDL
ncbi:MAG: alanine racemase [Bacteroidota bacterium]